MRGSAISFLVAAALFCSAGCTSTQVTQIDLTRTKLLIVGLAANPANRVKFEDVLCDKLAAEGVAVMASHGALPSLAGATRDAVVAVAREHAVTAVVAVAPVRVDAEGNAEVIGPGGAEQASFDAFLKWGVDNAHIAAGQVVFVTNLYQISTGRRVWGGVSWPFAMTSVDQVIEETATVIAENILTAQRQLLQLRGRGIDPAAAPGA